MKTVAFCTLGCKVNQYDSQAMLEQFIGAGYQPVPFSDSADVYVINTCTVTGTGDQKSRRMIRRAKKKNPGATIVVAGCLAQRAAEEIAEEGVKLVLGTQRRREVLALLEQSMSQQRPLIAVDRVIRPDFEPLTITRNEGHTRAALKIQEGCDNHCAYCVIPSVRGPVRSRPLSDIAAEAKRLSDAGYLEIVLTGIHLTSYGGGLPSGKDLASDENLTSGKDLTSGRNLTSDITLIDAIRAVHDVSGIRRVRLGSLEPTLFTESFAAALFQLHKVCPHFALSLQSGSGTVLSRMRRKYNTAQYQSAVECIRSYNPKAAVSADLMTGFPGETEEEFLETLAFVEAIGFARIHVFPYSERQGTEAASMPGSVPKRMRESRAKELIVLGKRMQTRYLSQWIHQDVSVLFETACESGASGYTPEYIRVIADGTPGQIRSVRVTSMEEDHLVGYTVI